MGKHNKLKYTYEDIKNLVEEHGCKLISQEYRTVMDKIEYICKCGNKHSRTVYFFLKSPRCPKCKRKIKNRPRKFTYKSVKKLFKKENCILLSKEYKNSMEKLEYICSCGNRSYTRLINFVKGKRCRLCGI